MQATLLSIISQKNTMHKNIMTTRKKTSKLPVILLHIYIILNNQTIVVSSKQNMFIRKPSELTLHLL